MRKRIIDNDKLIAIVSNAKSMAESARLLELPGTTFRHRAKRLGVYKPNQGGKGWKIPANIYTKERFVNEVLIKNSPRDKTYKNKLLLYKFNLKKEVCEICGQPPIWNGKKLGLQLDHRDGNRRNNQLDNLQILCPNCHTQTEYFSCKEINRVA